MRLERADVRPEMANWRSEWADLRLEEWVELGHEKAPNESKSCRTQVKEAQ